MEKQLIYYIDVRTTNDLDEFYKEFYSYDDMMAEYNSFQFQQQLANTLNLAYFGYGQKSIDLKKNEFFSEELKTKLNEIIRDYGINDTAKMLKITRQFIWLLRFNRVRYIKKTLAQKIKEVRTL